MIGCVVGTPFDTAWSPLRTRIQLNNLFICFAMVVKRLQEGYQMLGGVTRRHEVVVTHKTGEGDGVILGCHGCHGFLPTPYVIYMTHIEPTFRIVHHDLEKTRDARDGVG